MLTAAPAATACAGSVPTETLADGSARKSTSTSRDDARNACRSAIVIVAVTLNGSIVSVGSGCGVLVSAAGPVAVVVAGVVAAGVAAAGGEAPPGAAAVCGAGAG